MAIWTAALYIVTELTMGQVVEPLIYGHSTGLSPVAVIVAAIFWAWLWGPIGLIISTPLTLCLVVLGRHIEQLEFFDVLLGDRPPLTPVESFYQRMLAGDPDEAEEQAEQYLKSRTLSSYYDEVVLKGLQLAAGDSARGILNGARVARLREAVSGLVHDLDSHDADHPRHPKKKERLRDLHWTKWQCQVPAWPQTASWRRNPARRFRSYVLPAAGRSISRFPTCSRSC